MKVECRVPDSESANWKVETFEVIRDLGHVIHALHNPGRICPPGTYKRLMYKPTRDCMMSNTPAEIRDHKVFVRNAKGHVLINGLGIGIVLEMLLEKEEVTKITIIENNPEIINLVSPYFIKEDRVEILAADAFTYKPPKGVRYQAVWHDIWLNITSDNLEDMKKLHRKYGSKTDWQGSWCRDECERAKREEKRYGYW